MQKIRAGGDAGTAIIFRAPFALTGTMASPLGFVHGNDKPTAASKLMLSLGSGAWSGSDAMALFDRTLKIFASVTSLLSSTSAFAGDGQPSPWQMGFQRANSPIMEQITLFHHYLTIIIILITLFVLGLLVYVMVRFNERRHPQPSRTTHNTALEIAWTVIPILILVAIAIPSFRLLFAQYDYPKADLTITATGHQWYWSYEYPDQGIHFDAIMVQQADLKEGQPRLLTADHDVVVPVNKNIIVQVKATDVIHDWAVPSFGVKMDAVPGRLQKTWFRAERTGMYYGQCSELCGRNHAFMPIAVRVVTDEEFADWLAKTKPAASLDGAGKVAAAQN
jgi:cytochrome c oxidase subunit 2